MPSIFLKALQESTSVEVVTFEVGNMPSNFMETRAEMLKINRKIRRFECASLSCYHPEYNTYLEDTMKHNKYYWEETHNPSETLKATIEEREKLYPIPKYYPRFIAIPSSPCPYQKFTNPFENLVLLCEGIGEKILVGNPIDVSWLILSFLRLKDIHSMLQVCRSWCQFLTCPSTVKHIFFVHQKKVLKEMVPYLSHFFFPFVLREGNFPNDDLCTKTVPPFHFWKEMVKISQRYFNQNVFVPDDYYPPHVGFFREFSTFLPCTKFGGCRRFVTLWSENSRKFFDFPGIETHFEFQHIVDTEGYSSCRIYLLRVHLIGPGRVAVLLEGCNSDKILDYFVIDGHEAAFKRMKKILDTFYALYCEWEVHRNSIFDSHRSMIRSHGHVLQSFNERSQKCVSVLVSHMKNTVNETQWTLLHTLLKNVKNKLRDIAVYPLEFESRIYLTSNTLICHVMRPEDRWFQPLDLNHITKDKKKPRAGETVHGSLCRLFMTSLTLLMIPFVKFTWSFVSNLSPADVSISRSQHRGWSVCGLIVAMQVMDALEQFFKEFLDSFQHKEKIYEKNFLKFFVENSIIPVSTFDHFISAFKSQ